MRPRVIVPAILLLALTAPLAAQQPPAAAPRRPGAITVEEATLVTQGWALLAQGLLNEAARRAADALAAHPRSTGAIALAVEVEIARGGARSGLDQYERWLAARSYEEPLIVRRLARVVLQEIASGESADAARAEALRVLAADGDAAAAAELAKAASSGEPPEIRARAAAGDEQAVAQLVDLLNAGAGNAVSAIEALGRSGSRRAVQPLVDRLQHQAPEIRGAAVEALGELGRQFDVVPRIKPLLEDRSAFVRTRAAAALFKLDDMSGQQILQELWSAEHEKSRLMAAQATASRPDALWVDRVRQLTSAADPDVRITAARLLAPHDAAYARKVIDGGLADANPAVRQMAADALTESVGTDLRALRILLRMPDRLARTRAAARVLALVR